MRIEVSFSLLLLLVISSQARYLPDSSITSKETILKNSLKRDDAPPVPPRYSKGKAFYYDGWLQNHVDVEGFESVWKNLYDILNDIGHTNAADRRYQRWFGTPQGSGEERLVQTVFDRMHTAISPTGSWNDTDRKIWITRSDFAEDCQAESAGYSLPVSQVRKRSDWFNRISNRDKMKDHDYLIHVCLNQVPVMHDRQITECSQIKNRYVNFSVVYELVMTVLHELIHYPFIGDITMREWEQSKILQNDQEVLDPYNATKIAKECGVICNPCRSFKNPESYAFYTMNVYMDKKCSISLKPPVPSKKNIQIPTPS